MKDCFGTIFQLLSLFPILFQGPHHLCRGLDYMDWTHLKVMTALVIGHPITKEVAASKVTCVILIWKSHFFHFGLEQSPLCHFDLNKFSFVILFINKDGQSLIWLISKFFPLKSSPQRRLICRWRAKHPTKAPGTRWLWWLAWIARDLCSLQSCWGVSKGKVFAKRRTQLRWFRIEGLDRQDVPPWTRLVPR